MTRWLAVLFAVAACGSSPGRVAAPAQGQPEADPDGPHRAAVAAQVKPLIDGQIVSGIVVGLYDAGKVEIYGFGKGPGGAPPNGHTLFEIGSLTKIYTELLFADSVQRHEVALETPLSELLPPGVTAPTRDDAVITLQELALHSSGLPRDPRSVKPNAPNPYAGYNEEVLYGDLVQTELEAKPGTQITLSNFGIGVLGFVLGKKLGMGYPRAIEQRILQPLGLHDTYFQVPPPAQARRVTGTNSDLQPVTPWSWNAMAAAGGLVSTARDQLELIQAELEAASGSKLPLRGAMRFSQESELEGQGANEGLGWQIDTHGYWHNSGTAGFHAFVGFDPKTRRGVVILASTSVALVDRLSDAMWKVLDGTALPPPPPVPTPEQLAPLVGHYDFAGTKIGISANGNRLYLEGEGSKIRLVPFSDRGFWIEELQAVAVFEKEGDKIGRVVFISGEHQLPAKRID
jgi:CubicO group peptidase (beta-lactamase class C family)